MMAEQLYREIADLAPSVDPEAALALGEQHWAEITGREPNAHDAETCRLLSLAAIEQQPPDFLLADVWRTRALTRFALTGWYEGVASVAMSTAFVALAQVNNDYPGGQTIDVIEGSMSAVDILDGIKPFLQVPRVASALGRGLPARPYSPGSSTRSVGFCCCCSGSLTRPAKAMSRRLSLLRATRGAL